MNHYTAHWISLLQFTIKPWVNCQSKLICFWVEFKKMYNRCHADVHRNPVDTGRKLKVYKTFIRRLGRFLNALCTFNLRLVSTGKSHHLVPRMSRTSEIFNFVFSIKYWRGIFFQKQLEIPMIFLNVLKTHSNFLAPDRNWLFCVS